MIARRRFSASTVPAASQEIATALERLARNAERLALELRSSSTTAIQVRTRCRAMQQATHGLIRAKRSIPMPPERRTSERASSLVNADALRVLAVLAAFASHHGQRAIVDRAVLVEYVDAVRERAAALLARFDGNPAAGRPNAP